MATHSLIAHFLKENNYLETLKSFEKEHGKPIDISLPFDETLEEIIVDRNQFRNVKPIDEDNNQGGKDDDLLPAKLQDVARSLPNWTTPYPSDASLIDSITGLVVSNCVLRTGIAVVSTADLKIHVIDSRGKVSTQTQVIGRGVVKKIIEVRGRSESEDLIVLAGMDGKLYFAKLKTTDNGIEVEIESGNFAPIQAHKKLITDVQSFKSSDGYAYIVTLGWDFLLKVFRVTESAIEAVAETKLLIQGTCFAITAYQDNEYVILGKNEHTLLDVYNLQTLKLQFKISLNDAIFSTAGFTPRCIIVDGEKIVVATSHEPFMRMILVSLCFDDSAAIGSSEIAHVRRNQIIRNMNTLSPQDKFSQPLICWRSNFSGVWVAGEDGVLRGVDLKSQRVIIELNAHKGKIKSLYVGTKDNEEILISSGIDRDIKTWK